MEVMGVLGFIFGLAAFVRLETLIKKLRDKNIIDTIEDEI
tara:strand:- start:273 stop:392 length:120 start_codon:yes stop_codon:yes gene_type:complete